MNDARLWGPEPPLIDPAEVSDWILYEDNDLFVVNKPGWVVCHPSKNGPWSSLVGAVREHLGDEGRLHLVARLDRETSGLVLIARHRAAASLWQTAIERRHVSKRYLAILVGELNERHEVSAALEPDNESRVAVKQRVARHGGGRKAQTTFVPLHVGNGFTLAQVIPHTGRKHQIRVHGQHIGFPIAGDKLYGPDESLYLEFVEHGWTDRLSEALPVRRQALHAWEVSYETIHSRHCFRAPLAEDLVLFGCGIWGLTIEELQHLLPAPSNLNRNGSHD